MHSRRESALRHATYYLDVVSANQKNYELLDLERGNLDRVISTCLKYEEWKLLSKFIVFIGDFYKTRNLSEEYKGYATLLLEKHDVEDYEKINLLLKAASIEEDQGRYDVARSLLDRQLKLIEKSALNEKNIVDVTLKKVVELAKSQGDNQNAIRYLEKRLSLAGKAADFREEADILIELARLYVEINDYDKAEQYSKKVLTLAQGLGYTIGIIDSLRELALVYLNQKMYDQAVNVLNQAVDIASKTSDRRRVSDIKQILSGVERKMAKKIFISYNHRDRAFVEKLARDLKAKGLLVWWDEWEINVGDSIVQKVGDGIKTSAFLAVVLSPHSAQSNWVQREVGSAMMRQLSKERSITILPLLITDCEIPVLLDGISYADFRNEYKLAFKKLLKALS